MAAIPLPPGNNSAVTIRRLRAIDAEFFGTLYANDIVSANWDGADPIDLSAGPDTGMTTGYGFDASAGIMQIKQIFAAPGTALVPALTSADVAGTGIYFYASGLAGGIGFSLDGTLTVSLDETSGFGVNAPLIITGSSGKNLQYNTLPTAQTGTTAVLYSNGSSYDLVPQSSTKKHKKLITRRDQLAVIDLIPTRYKRKGGNVWEYGLIAEDLVKQDPVLGIWDQNLGEYNDYNTRGVIAVLVAKVNRQKALLDGQEERLYGLENALEALTERVAALELI